MRERFLPGRCHDALNRLLIRVTLRLAEAMLKEVVGSGLRCRYIVFDTH